MDFIFDKITISDLIQIVLIFVFVIQTAYLATQTNFLRRSSQANLTEVWKKEFTTINFDVLYPEKPNLPDPVEFEALVKILQKMHPHFRERLLKPSDFSIMFLVLFFATLYDDFRKDKVYKENYLNLQVIFNDFNKDPDVVLFFLSMPSTSIFEDGLKTIRSTKGNEKLQKKLLHNWVGMQVGFRIGAWIKIKIKRKGFFELKPPIL